MTRTAARARRPGRASTPVLALWLALTGAGCGPSPAEVAGWSKRHRPGESGAWVDLPDLVTRLGGRHVVSPPELIGLAIGREARALSAAALPGTPSPEAALVVHASGAMGPAIPHVGDGFEDLDALVSRGGRIAVLAYGDRREPEPVRIVVPLDGGREALATTMARPDAALHPTWGERGAAAGGAALQTAIRLGWSGTVPPTVVLVADGGFEVEEPVMAEVEAWFTRTHARLVVIERGKKVSPLVPAELRSRVGLEVVAFAARVGATLHTASGARAALQEARALAASPLLDVPDPRSLDVALVVEGVFPREELAEAAVVRTLGSLAALGVRVGLVRVASVPGGTPSIEVVSPLSVDTAGFAKALIGAPEPARAVDGPALDLWAALDGTIRALAWAPERRPVIVAVVRDEAVHVAGSADETSTAWVRARGARVHLVATAGLK